MRILKSEQIKAESQSLSDFKQMHVSNKSCYFFSLWFDLVWYNNCLRWFIILFLLSWQPCDFKLLHVTQNYILTRHKRNSVYITFHRAQNVESSQFCHDEINACADVSSHITSFRVVFRWYFITRNEVSLMSKRPQWNNTRN